MPHSLLDGHQIRACFIKMKSECMAEAMESEAHIAHATSIQILLKYIRHRLRADVFTGLLSRKEPILCRRALVIQADIIDKMLVSFFGQDGIAI